MLSCGEYSPKESWKRVRKGGGRGEGVKLRERNRILKDRLARTPYLLLWYPNFLRTEPCDVTSLSKALLLNMVIKAIQFNTSFGGNIQTAAPPSPSETIGSAAQFLCMSHHLLLSSQRLSCLLTASKCLWEKSDSGRGSRLASQVFFVLIVCLILFKTF